MSDASPDLLHCEHCKVGAVRFIVVIGLCSACYRYRRRNHRLPSVGVLARRERRAWA